jgi:tRNA 2-thiouridine synthesizing protein E
MSTIEYNDITINVDDEGYLLNVADWDEKVACALTQTVEDVDECDLTDDRLEILRFMRDYYMRFESFPIVRQVCKNVHQDDECLYEQFIDPLRESNLDLPPPPYPLRSHHGSGRGCRREPSTHTASRKKVGSSPHHAAPGVCISTVLETETHAPPGPLPDDFQSDRGELTFHIIIYPSNFPFSFSESSKKSSLLY